MRYYEKVIDAEWEEIPPVAIRSDGRTCALRSDGRSTLRRFLYALRSVVTTIALGLLIGRILGFFIYGQIL